MSYTWNELIRYRIERSKEAFEDARILMKEERYNSAANRLYYACFYIISAYLLLHELKATTHAGLKVIFNKEMVKTGKVNKEDGILFNKLFGIRQDADYEDFFKMSKEDIAPLLPKVNEMIKKVEALINKGK